MYVLQLICFEVQGSNSFYQYDRICYTYKVHILISNSLSVLKNYVKTPFFFPIWFRESFPSIFLLLNRKNLPTSCLFGELDNFRIWLRPLPNFLLVPDLEDRCCENREKIYNNRLLICISISWSSISLRIFMKMKKFSLPIEFFQVTKTYQNWFVCASTAFFCFGVARHYYFFS